MLYNLYYLKEWEVKEIFKWAMGEKKTFSQSLGFNRFQIGMKIQSVYTHAQYMYGDDYLYYK